MIDLKEVITKYPECLESSEKLRAYLTDLYPSEKAKVSIIVAIFNCGIAGEIKNSASIEDIVIERFCTRLENDYGYSQKLSKECIDLWLWVYEKVLDDIESVENTVTMTTAVQKNINLVVSNKPVQNSYSSHIKKIRVKKILSFVISILIVAIITPTVLSKIDWNKNDATNNTIVESVPVENEAIIIESVEEKETKKIKQCLSNAKVGEYVKFGTYEQDGDFTNGEEEIDWRVLDIVDEKILMMSKCSLDYQKYNYKTENVTWETCTLRNWLNTDFFNAAFSEIEKTLIPTVTVSADRFHNYPTTDPGNDTQDKVFLLSSEEVKKYLPQISDRIGENTKYVNGKPNSLEDDKWWWLRSPGSNNSQAANIYYVLGSVGFGFMTVGTLQPVRPVIWVDVS